MTKERSPFSPGRPVPVEFFVGRATEIERVLRSVKQVASGKQENLFLTGERGIGKSSLASFIRYLAEKRHDFLTAHAYIGGITTMPEVVKRIFEGLVQLSVDSPVFDKLKSVLGRHIREIDLFGVTVEFNMEPNELKLATSAFVPALDRIYERVRDEKKGLLLILDDINGITDTPAFSHFLKSVVDEIATRQRPLPLLLLLTGVPERREEMIEHQPSIGRIFDVIEIKPFSDTETENFYQLAFSKHNISVEPPAMKLLCRYSGGLPMLLHEVGDAVFWVDTDNRISSEDAVNGIVVAADIVGKKYLDRQVYSAIRSDRYRSILQKLVKPGLEMSFLRKDIAGKLTADEKRVLDNFLTRMKDLCVIRSGSHAGEYIFANNLFRLYMSLQAEASSQQK